MKEITPLWAKKLFIPGLLLFFSLSIIIISKGLYLTITGGYIGVLLVFLGLFFLYLTIEGKKLYKFKNTSACIQNERLIILDNTIRIRNEYLLKDLTIKNNWVSQIYYVYDRRNREECILAVDYKYQYGVELIAEIIEKQTLN